MPEHARARAAFLVPLLALLIALPACSDSSAPRPSATVVVTATVTEGPVYGQDVSGSPTIECTTRLEATASGTGAALWDTGSLFFYEAANPTVALDTIQLTAATVGEYWDATEIAIGDVQELWITFRAPFAFAVGFAFRYRPRSGAPLRTAEARFSCG